MKCPFGLPVRKVVKASKSIWVYSKDEFLICKSFGHQRADYIVHIINSHEKLVKHIEALKSVCETYIPADKMDEANSKVILFCMGNVEEIGRKLISKKPSKRSK